MQQKNQGGIMAHSAAQQGGDRDHRAMDKIASFTAYQQRAFGTFQDLLALLSAAYPEMPAIICDDDTISYSALDELVNRVAAGLQRDGVRKGSVIAICASSSIDYVAVLIGALRAGVAFSPLSPAATGQQLGAMIVDSGAMHFFADKAVSEQMVGLSPDIRRIGLGEGSDGFPFAEWLPESGAKPDPVDIGPDDTFNIIYSSGTTGTPKGIVQPYRLRWSHMGRAGGYGPGSVTIVSTGLYSNTTLVGLFPALATGGTVVLMRKFDAERFLQISEQYRANYAMLVPVQYHRIMAVPSFGRYNLSSYIMKFATSAPFSAQLKAEVLARWPGGLIEWYGMTEGGGACELVAHVHREKLHTVGRPIEGHDMRVIDESGHPVPPGTVGEVVGRSDGMMTGYHNQPGKTSETEWWSSDGNRFIRTGDLASVDEDGFFTLVGRKKDLIISGGINIYPIDLEDALLAEPAVLEAAVVGVPSPQWGETPVGFVTLRSGMKADARELCAAANERLGRMQRLSEVRILRELPRNAIGKVLKRDLPNYPAADAAE